MKSPTYSNYTASLQDSSLSGTIGSHPGSLSNLNTLTAKTGMKGLSIDTNEETTNKFNLSNVGAYSATNNSGASMYGLTKNSLVSGMNGTLTTKNTTKTTDVKKTPIISPAKNLTSTKTPTMSTNYSATGTSNLSQTTPNSAGISNSRLSGSQSANINSLLNSLSPSNSNNQIKSLTAKSQILDVAKSSYNESGNSSHLNSQNIPSESLSGTSTPLSTTSKKQFTPIPNHEPTKCSVKRNGIVKAYAANTNQGIVRNYNEDRVSIILNIMKPASRVNETWPKCSFFGIYDGHGGVLCADFLRDHLHQFVIKEPTFPWNPKEALAKGFEAAEKSFLEIAQTRPTNEIDRSGSCAVVVLIVGDMCYVANVGDSRAVMSGDSGARIFPLSRDHKPMDDQEQKRILEAGGRIYQTQAPALKAADGNMGKAQMQLLLGPHRVLPGRLSVCRTFGDIEAKLPKFGGNPNVVIAVPEIKSFKIAPEYDFIVLASDGIYDKMSSREVVKTVWESTELEKASSIHQQCGLAVENILRDAIHRRTLDNITVVIIGFKNFKQKLFPRSNSSSQSQVNNENIPEISRTTSLKASQTSLKSSIPSTRSVMKEMVNGKEDNHLKTLQYSGDNSLLGKSTEIRKSYIENKTAPLVDINPNTSNVKKTHARRLLSSYNGSQEQNSQNTSQRSFENSKPEQLLKYSGLHE
jgi:protein phosphatase 2C family protein 2/3